MSGFLLTTLILVSFIAGAICAGIGFCVGFSRAFREIERDRNNS